jgi:hypothetical protein
LENNLTGRWRCNDNGTYYIRQSGDTLWWLGRDERRKEKDDKEEELEDEFDVDSYYTNVFKGRILNDTIEGEWSDVPLGDTMNHGELKIEIKKDNDEIILLRISASGGFGGSIWEKMSN